MGVKVCAELGINHNSSLALALEMVQKAKDAGADFVKFQKRTPELCVPLEQRAKRRETPWGEMSYMEYKERMEFGPEQYQAIDGFCKKLGIPWFASAWDIPSVEFLLEFDTPYIKIPSAKATDRQLLNFLFNKGKPSILSTGMCDWGMMQAAVDYLQPQVLMHTVSTYPCPVEELNLACIPSMRESFPACEIGYSGHEVGLAPSLAAVVLGATWVERHFTLDRSMWGSDQAASVEPGGFRRLVKDIRLIEQALGDGVKRIMPGEHEAMKRLRGGA